MKRRPIYIRWCRALGTYFLSRPRQFGKSLLLSTMQSYFEGRRELFDGLYIGEQEQEWTQREVLKIDFSNGKYFTLQHLQSANGRIDVVLRMPKTIYVLELKYGHSSEEAIGQADRKDYAAAFALDGRRVVEVGINFSRDEHTVTEWNVLY